MRKIILCGLPGCGKTTVGAQLVKLFSRSLMDVDTLIEQAYEKGYGTLLTCRHIFSQKGEFFFREIETQIIASLTETTKEGDIISLGGGALENAKNIEVLKSLGAIVYLKVQVDTAFSRIAKQPLPSYLHSTDPFDSFQKIAIRRIPIFIAAAEMEIDTTHLTPLQIADLIGKKMIEIDT